QLSVDQRAGGAAGHRSGPPRPAARGRPDYPPRPVPPAAGHVCGPAPREGTVPGHRPGLAGRRGALMSVPGGEECILPVAPTAEPPPAPGPTLPAAARVAIYLAVWFFSVMGVYTVLAVAITIQILTTGGGRAG